MLHMRVSTRAEELAVLTSVHFVLLSPVEQRGVLLILRVRAEPRHVALRV